MLRIQKNRLTVFKVAIALYLIMIIFGQNKNKTQLRHILLVFRARENPE